MPSIAIIGGGPAGLIAAETLLAAGQPVTLYEAMPSVGRKFLIAGNGGLNLTHSEPYAAFVARYGNRAAQLRPYLAQFTPDDLRDWVHEFGIETFVGSSGRVFPAEMKAGPLLSAWKKRLLASGLVLKTKHRWLGWTNTGELRFTTPDGETNVTADATLLALGGASWPQTGSDGQWVDLLAEKQVPLTPMQPANCGFERQWSPHFQSQFAGSPIKSVTLTFGDFQRRGEFIATEYGIEGSLIYAVSAHLRDAITREGQATIQLDLTPDYSLDTVKTKLTQRGSKSLSSFLKQALGLSKVKINLLYEIGDKTQFSNPDYLAPLLKALPLDLDAPRPIAEAISVNGGVAFAALTPDLMLTSLPGTFCAGEMLDWEAPTGGYLLTACFATGKSAAVGMRNYLDKIAAKS